MMMEKPSAAARPKEQPQPSQKPQPLAKKKSAEEAVAELEQRLAALGGPSPTVVAPDAANEGEQEEHAPMNQAVGSTVAAFPPTEPQQQLTQPPATQLKGGKSALLARIMAAQEKSKTTTAPPAIQATSPPPAYDSGLMAPVDPPPSFPMMMMAEPPLPPPPAFASIEHSVMPPIVALEPPPAYFMPAAAPPAASAPAFEDYLDHFDEPPPYAMAPPPPPQTQEEDIIMGMEGLSPEERSALMEEQRRIMEQIEREKLANKSAIASVQADNFDMRSTANALTAVGTNRAPTTRPPSGAVMGSKVNLGGGTEVALHGPERTQEAIKDGTAVLVQCVNCENWMQVTGSATLMYCPVCAVVSPIDRNNAAMSKEEALQMDADRRMAEMLQNEEYEVADQAEGRVRETPRQAAAAQKPPQESSWWDTVTGMFSSETKETAPAPVPVQPSPSQVPSYDERQSLTGDSSTNRPAARVAQRQPLFSCVVDSVNSTVGTLTGTSLNQDREGNVHGVDATSLLAVSNVGRDTDYQPYNDNNN